MSESLAWRFKKKHESISGITHIVPDVPGACEALAEILAAADVQRVVLAGLPADLEHAIETRCAQVRVEVLKAPFASADLPREVDQAQAGVTGAAFAIAESGTVGEVSNDDAIRLASALPDTHVAIVREADIVETIGEAAARIDKAFEKTGACAVSLISGPSRSGDIGMQLTLGVHGPRAAHVIILSEPANGGE